jgi:bifunctional non-homologous end joining protein LigD
VLARQDGHLCEPRAPMSLSEYRRRRDPGRTPEPVPAADDSALPQGEDDTFVIQEHHARALHWDFRLERNGVLVSWAVPKGLPTDPARNHLAVHTEDHPLEYAAFAGAIPSGEYGGGEVTIWDSGHYVCEKWTEREVKVVLTGRRVSGRYVLFQTKDRNWMVHRMDEAVGEPLPRLIKPMLAVPGTLAVVGSERDWAFETKWDGVRVVAYNEGGRLRLLSRNDRDVTASYPELAPLGAHLGSLRVVLDGEVVCFGPDGRPSFSRLQNRMHVTGRAQAQQLARTYPAVYVIFDLLHHDGTSLLQQSYDERRTQLLALGLSGPSWQSPPMLRGSGEALLQASREYGLEGLIAKRRSARYRPGARSADWRKIKNIRTQEVVVGGWKPGNGRRAGTIGSLLLGIPDPDGLRFVGHVGTGFSDAVLRELTAELRRIERHTSPFAGELPRSETKDAHWVTPRLVGEVAFGEWTDDGRLRHPAWRGLRPDKAPDDVTVES